jgi:hypothetical protein
LPSWIAEICAGLSRPVQWLVVPNDNQHCSSFGQLAAMSQWPSTIMSNHFGCNLNLVVSNSLIMLHA